MTTGGTSETRCSRKCTIAVSITSPITQHKSLGLDLWSNAHWPQPLVTQTFSPVPFLGVDNKLCPQTVRNTRLPNLPCAKPSHLFKVHGGWGIGGKDGGAGEPQVWHHCSCTEVMGAGIVPATLPTVCSHLTEQREASRVCLSGFCS